MVLKIQLVRPCMVLNVLVRYWKFEYGTERFSTIQGRTITTQMVRHRYPNGNIGLNIARYFIGQ